jgi:hypothetical protein
MENELLALGRPARQDRIQWRVGKLYALAPALVTILGSACSQVNAIGLSGTVQVAEQFPGVPSGAISRRAGSTTKSPWQQIRTSLRVAAKLMDAGHTEWIGNDKSVSRLMSAAHLAIRRPHSHTRTQACRHFHMCEGMEPRYRVAGLFPLTGR